MNIIDLARAAARRWYIVLAGVVAAAAVGGFLYQSLPTSYESGAVVTVVPPTFVSPALSPEDALPTNPFLRLDNAVAQTAHIVLAQVDTAASHENVAARTGGSYEVTNIDLQPETYTPTIRITATAAEPRAAMDTANGVIEEIDTSLALLQDRANVPPDTALRLDLTVVPAEGVAASSSRAKSAAAGAVAVALLSLLLALVTDAVLGRRVRGSLQPHHQPASRTSHAGIDKQPVASDGRPLDRYAEQSPRRGGHGFSTSSPVPRDPSEASR